MSNFKDATPIEPHLYKRYLPTAFDDSLTLLEKVNRILQFLEVVGWNLSDGLSQEVLDQLEKWRLDGTLENIMNDFFRYEKIGDESLELLGSLYLKNDKNLFGRKSDGTHANLATMQDNNIAQYGDYAVPVMWFIAMDYFSFRSKGNPTYQQIDDNGNAIGSGRTILHQGNACNHAVVFSSGTQTLFKGVDNNINILNNVNGVFPTGNFVNGVYTIPRAGMYFYDVAVKLGVTPPRQGYIRFVAQITKPDGSVITSNMEDVLYDPASYGTPFVSASFMYRHSNDDKVRILVHPLTDDVTIESGTKLYLYGLGDTIQE
jgi:hypothetical protein